MAVSKTRLYTTFSLICLLIAVAMLGIWSYLIDPSSTFSVIAFAGYIPGLSENVTLTTVLSMFLYAAAILFAVKGDTTTTKNRYGIHFWIMAVATCLLILNGYSLIR